MGAANRYHRFLQKTVDHFGAAVDAGIIRIRVDDEVLSGDTIDIGGRRLVNFGLCSYLGLSLDPRIKRGAIEAVERYGSVYSSSAAYTSIPLFTELETRLEQILGGTVVLPTTTTLGHLSALPVLIGPGDVAIVDAQAHASVQMATQLMRGGGVTIETVPHNDLDALRAAVADAAERHESVWYLADGVYSMWGDTAPFDAVAALMEEYANLHVYYDDAHGFGWAGVRGRGVVLDAVPLHERMVVAVSLAKSFGAGGAGLVFPNADLARKVLLCGGTMTFSGPIYPSELGAAVASADIHMSVEHALRQSELLEHIDLTSRLLREAGLPVMADARTPIWFVRVGGPDEVIDITTRLMREGYYVNPSAFPAVPLGQGGVRFTNTLYHSEEQIVGLVDALARHVPEVIGETAITIDLRDPVAVPNPLQGTAAS